MNTTQQKESFIARTRQAALEILEIHELLAEYTATDAGNVITDADFVGINEGIVTSDMTSFIGSVLTPVKAILDGAGVDTVTETYKAVP